MFRTAYLGVTFNESMTGPAMLGETEPIVGAACGQETQLRLTMRASIHIPDVRAFVADPLHTGTISGFIDFPPLAANMPAHGGVFRLFAPSNDPTLHWMVYELGFEHCGAHYYLAGKKEIRPGSIFRLWPETTTLYVQLHQGTDSSGAITGAGILKLGLPQFIRLLLSLSALQPQSLVDRVRGPAIFGAFFVRQLWMTYVFHR